MTFENMLTTETGINFLKVIAIIAILLFIGKQLEKRLVRLRRLTKKGRKLYRQGMLFMSTIPLAQYAINIFQIENLVIIGITYFIVYKLVKKNRRLLQLM